MSVTSVRRTLMWALVLSSLSAQGVVVITGDIADASIRSSGSVNNGINAKRIGAATGAPGAGSRVGVFVFQLPALGPNELPIVSSADFAINVQTNYAGTLYDLDLYGITARSQPTVLSDDNYCGSWTTALNLKPKDTLVQSRFIQAGNSLTGYMHPSADGDSNLAAYLTSQYGVDGSGAGKWVFLRINAAMVPNVENSGIDVSMAEDANAPPMLSITLVPEPGVAFLAVWTLCVCISRRKRDDNL